MTEAKPTRVGPGLRESVREPVAHGPEKRLGAHRTVTVSCTMPESLYVRARETGLVFSRILQLAVEAELGGSDLARIDAELEALAEQTRILRAAREQMVARKQEEEVEAERRQARLNAIQGLADTFYSQGRAQLRRAYNLAWLQGRIQIAPALHGSTPEEILGLILEMGGPREGGGETPSRRSLGA
jgi:post-segregation antitoxin (ccd killing protein)